MTDRDAAAPPWAVHLPAGTDWQEVDLLAAGSLPAAWSRRWREDPHRQVIRDESSAWVTGSELLERSAHLAGRLAGAGLRPGDRTLLSGPATIEFVVAYVAALRSGFVVVPVNNAYTAPELEALIDAASPKAAIIASGVLRDVALTCAPGLIVTDLDVDLPDSPAPTLDAVHPSDPALLPFTSGTTGRPKGVSLSHGNLLASAESVRLAWRWSEQDRLILSLPLFHIHGLGVGLNGTLLAGGSAILHDRFDPEHVLSTAADATMFFGVPTMYARLVESAGAERLKVLRLCVSGSAPLSGALHEQIGERCGQVVLERYGMTETVMLVSNPFDGERRPGSVGLPLPGVDLRLGGGGDILVKGPNVFSGYFRQPEADETAFDADGWFRTGDIGEFDDDGYLRIIGRSKELIISGGFNVFPREIEDVLREHPSIRDVAVAGTPSSEWGEIVTAYIETDSEVLDEHALTAWASTRLVGYKRPRLFHRVDELPRNKLGKIVRSELSPPPS